MNLMPITLGIGLALARLGFGGAGTPAAAAPTVSAANPSTLAQGDTQTVTLTGTGFLAGATVDAGPGVTVGTPTVVSSTSITVALTAASNAYVAARDLVVTNTDARSGTLAGGLSITLGVTVLLDATFTAANGTAVEDYVPPTGTFDSKSGSWQVNGNKLTDVAGGIDYVLYECGTANVTIYADITFPASGVGYKGLLACATNGLSGYMLLPSTDNTAVRFLENAGDVESVAFAFAPSTTYRFQFVKSGDNIKGYIDGVQLFNRDISASANKGNTKHGVWAYATDAGATVDNLHATGAGSAPAVDTTIVVVDGALGSNVTDGTYDYATRASGTGYHARNAYKTVAAAVAAVDAAGTVDVRAGTYRELVNAAYCFAITKGMTFRGYSGDARPVLTYVALTPPVADMDGSYGQILRVTTTAAVTVQDVEVVGTFDLGDSTQDLDANIYTTAAVNLTLRRVKSTKSSHAWLKYSTAPASVLVEYCDLAGGGFTTRDHAVYDPFGGGVYRRNAIHGYSGGGIHVFDQPAGAVDADGNAVWDCALVGILLGNTHGNHRARNNTVVHCGTAGISGAGISVWGVGSQAELDNNYVRCPTAVTTDLRMEHSGQTVAGSHNRYNTLSGSGYSGTGDVATLDIFTDTPSVLTDLRRTGGATDGVAVTGVSDTLLDPAQNTPTGKAVAGAPPIGAFAN